MRPSPRRSTDTHRSPPLALPGEEGRGFFQDLPLHLQGSDPSSQLAQLGALVGGQALGLAGVDLSLALPVAQRLIGDPEILRDLGDRLVRDLDQLECFAPELRRVRRLALRHWTPPSRSLSTPAVRCRSNRGHSISRSGSRWNIYEGYRKVGYVNGGPGGPAAGAALLLLL